MSPLPRDASLEIVIAPWRKRVCVQASPEALSVAFDHPPWKKLQVVNARPIRLHYEIAGRRSGGEERWRGWEGEIGG